MTECDLYGNNFGIEGWVAIFDALRMNPSNKIIAWNLTDEDITTESLAAYMTQSLLGYMRNSECLQYIDLRGNNFDCDSAASISTLREKREFRF